MDNNDKKYNFRIIWSLVMIAIYLGFSYMLIFTSIFDNFDDKLRIIMGIVLTLYGFLRGYRLWKQGK